MYTLVINGGLDSGVVVLAARDIYQEKVGYTYTTGVRGNRTWCIYCKRLSMHTPSDWSSLIEVAGLLLREGP